MLVLVAVQLAVEFAVRLAVRRRRLSPQVLAALADVLLRRFSAAHSQRMVHEWAAAAVRRRRRHNNWRNRRTMLGPW